MCTHAIHIKRNYTTLTHARKNIKAHRHKAYIAHTYPHCVCCVQLNTCMCIMLTITTL